MSDLISGVDVNDNVGISAISVSPVDAEEVSMGDMTLMEAFDKLCKEVIDLKCRVKELEDIKKLPERVENSIRIKHSKTFKLKRGIP